MRGQVGPARADGGVKLQDSELSSSSGDRTSGGERRAGRAKEGPRQRGHKAKEDGTAEVNPAEKTAAG